MENLGDVNATGNGVREDGDGNNTRGVLDQVRPTGIMATGNKKRGSLEDRKVKERKPAGR